MNTRKQSGKRRPRIGANRATRRAETAGRRRADRIARAIARALYLGTGGLWCFRSSTVVRLARQFGTPEWTVRGIAIATRDAKRAAAKAAAEKEAA